MAGRLPVARRAELAASAYELSLQGHSFREIARQLDISHPTASALVHEEAKRRREEREDPGQRLRDSIKLALRRAWKELERPDASSHAVSQNLFALNNLLNTYAKVTGAFAPERLQVNGAGFFFPDEGISLLSDVELQVLERLVLKSLGDIPAEQDVLKNLPEPFPRPDLELEPLAEE
jgi:hypothetical protein